MQVGPTMTASVLWSRLREMEDERRFNGQSYPEGTCSFPFTLTGQGFFPGGDGLWRDDDQLHEASLGHLPLQGAVFVGNDFGTLKSYRRLQRRGYENPPTWRHLKQRIRRGGLPVRKTYFTNTIVGLRSATNATALDKRRWQSNPDFIAFCLEFFVYQLAIIKPRLVVVMGQSARSTLLSFVPAGSNDEFCRSRVIIGRYETTLHYISHPYADFNLNEDQRAIEALALRRAWEQS